VRSILKELVLPLLLALVHGAVYVFMVPPWQHYDEPGHTEYVWHIVHKQRLPLPGDVDREMRFDFAESMVRHGFYRNAEAVPVLDRANGPTPDIGYVQLEDSPLYYIAPALAVWLVRDQSIEIQLYAARSVSLVMLLFCVTCAWGVARTLTPAGHAIRWMLPLSLALLPPFVDLMTSVSSDVGAIAAYSLFVWGSSRMVQRNTEQRDGVETAATALWIILSAALCLMIKASAASAVAVTVPVMTLGLIPRRYAAAAMALLAALAAIAVLTIFRSGDAAAWYRTDVSARVPLTRCGPPECARIAHGSYAIRVTPEAQTPGRLLQSFPPDHTAQLRGKIVTIAGWAWVDIKTAATALPSLSANYASHATPDLALSETPTFFAYTSTVPANTHYLRLTLKSPPGAQVFYDGLIVIEGEPPLDETPVLLDASAAKLMWAGIGYDNMLRNASAESEAFGLRPQAANILELFAPSWMTWPLGISSVLDLRGSGWYYFLVLRNLYESFWGRFAWGQIAIPDAAFLVIGVGLLLIASSGVLRWTRQASLSSARVLLLVFVSLSGVLFPAAIRGISTGLEWSLWLPGARYIFPNIVVFMALFTYGFHAALAFVSERGRANGVFVACMSLLAITGMATCLSYYRG
jgi:hypothetical protein